VPPQPLTTHLEDGAPEPSKPSKEPRNKAQKSPRGLSREVKKEDDLVQGRVHYKVKGLDWYLDIRYELNKWLGGGTFGQVCSGYDHETESKVAIKRVEAILLP